MKITKLVCWQTGGCSCPQSYPTLLSHGLQHTRLPCLSPSPRICSDPCPLSWWCHLTISSLTPFSSCPQFFPASGLFQWASSSHQVVKVLEFQVQYRSFRVYSVRISLRIDWYDHLAVQGTLNSLRQHHSSKTLIHQCSAFFMVQLSHPYMTTGKTIALTIQTFVSQGMSLFFNMLSRFVIAFLPRRKSLNFIAAVTIHSDFGAQENKVCHCFHFFPPSMCYEVMGLDAIILVFWMLNFKPAFSLSPSSGGSLTPLRFLPVGWSLHICISEVIDISPSSSVDSSLIFIQPSISHDVFCI